MNIILLSKFCKRHGSVDLCLPGIALWSAGILISLAALVLWAGYQLGAGSRVSQADGGAGGEVQRLLMENLQLVEQVQQDSIANLDALALEVGRIQANVMRLNALGEHMVEAGGLDPTEFDFRNNPAQGGAGSGQGESQSAAEIVAQLQEIAATLKDRERKLLLLDELMLDRSISDVVIPSGRPVEKGWLSSGFGRRTDPFTGKKRMHNGLDFAGKEGTEVKAVAAGVVVKSQRDGAYGNLIEIRHADGYSTRYGHNKTNLVEVGQTVSKGETIALLGSSGRSSGPHVHLEVRKDGKALNPRSFVNN